MNKSSRNPTRPKFSYKKRLDISEDMHGRIDMLLKDLRSCAQRLAPLLSALEDEMRILERLYYKGRNQHRSALFWRKVEEMRRYGKRILELQSFEQVDSLRYSFYVGDDAVRQGSWVQIPEKRFVTFLRDYFQGSIALLNKACERLVKVYETFILMLQTGAFLQLIVVLTALVSRINTLSNDIRSILGPVCDALSTLDAILQESALSKAPATDTLETRLDDTEAEDTLSAARFGNPEVTAQEVDVSVKTVMSWPGSACDTGGPVATTSLESNFAHEQTPAEDTSISRATFVTQQAIPGAPEKREIVSTTASRNVGTEPLKSDEVKMKSDAPSASLKKTKRKKRPRDEIDDIFGAL